jgi:hypothetical protein
VLANANTGLPSQQTFYIGHLQGEVNGLEMGGASGALQVTNADLGVVRLLIGIIATMTSVVDITKNGLVQNSDITAIRSGLGVRQLRLNTIPIAGSGNEGTGNSGGSGNWGGNNARGNGDNGGDGSGGVGDESSLGGFAMMAPLVDMGSKADKTNAMNSSDPSVSDSARLQHELASSFDVPGTINAPKVNPSNDLGIEQGNRNSASSGTLDSSLSDDFFASFDDREIM